MADDEIGIRFSDLRAWLQTEDARRMMQESDPVHDKKHADAGVPCRPCVCGCACVLVPASGHGDDCPGIQ